jgi:leucyl-tRNA synthetase
MPRDLKSKIVKIGELREEQMLKEAKEFLEREFKADVYVFNEEARDFYDPKNRAQAAKPYRPAIYIE